MTKPIRRSAFALIVLVTVLVGARLGASATAYLAEKASRGDVSPLGTAATESVSGHLEISRLPSAAVPTGSWSEAVTVVMEASDWTNCENLGQQVRALRRRAIENSVPLVFWTRLDSLERLRVILRRESLAGTPLIALPRLDILGDGAIQTPAAILFAPDGEIVSGISHPTKAANVRGQSFARELDWTQLSR